MGNGGCSNTESIMPKALASSGDIYLSLSIISAKIEFLKVIILVFQLINNRTYELIGLLRVLHIEIIQLFLQLHDFLCLNHNVSGLAL